MWDDTKLRTLRAFQSCQRLLMTQCGLTGPMSLMCFQIWKWNHASKRGEWPKPCKLGEIEPKHKELLKVHGNWNLKVFTLMQKKKCWKPWIQSSKRAWKTACYRKTKVCEFKRNVLNRTHCKAIADDYSCPSGTLQHCFSHYRPVWQCKEISLDWVLLIVPPNLVSKPFSHTSPGHTSWAQACLAWVSAFHIPFSQQEQRNWYPS